ncbi:MAG: hypothetical protein WA945_03585 [Arcobacteraceae bacterium]
MDYTVVDTPPIANFPDDDKFRVVYAFGAINTHVNNNIPEVTILLKEVSLQNNKIILNSQPDKITKIALNEVRIVSLMSVWNGKKKTNLIYKLELDGVKNFYNKRAQFNFGLEKPISIAFASSSENETVSKSLIPKLRIELDEGFYLPSFLSSKYLKIIDIKQRIFFIPTIEFLVSAYTFETQEITNQLVLSSIEDILNNELEKALIDENIYEIELTKGREVTTEVFLAYAACNEITQKRIKAIRSSIESSEYKYVSPTVLPYHPHKMELEFNCFKFEDNKYLVYKVNGVSSPLEYIVESIKIKKKQKQKKQDKDEEMSAPINRQEVDDDIEISSNVTPHKLQAKKSVLHTVKLLGDTTHKEIKRKKQRQDASKRVFQKKVDKDLTSLSSAEENSQKDSENTGKVNYEPVDRAGGFKPLEGSQLRQVIKIIEGFVANQKEFKINGAKIKIESFKYITSRNNKIQYYDDVALGDFIKSSNSNIKSVWLKEKIFNKENEVIYSFRRKYLLMELILSNGKYLYLFEIEKRIKKGYKDEKFKGLIFSVENKGNNQITNGILKKLLKCFIQNRKVVVKCITEISYGNTFIHLTDREVNNRTLKETTIVNAIENLFDKKYQKNKKANLS